MIDNERAARAATASSCARWALRGLLLAMLTIFAQAPAAQAQTWLDERFYDDPPRRPGAGQWTSRSAYAAPAKKRRHAKSDKRRLVLSDSELDHGMRAAKRRARGYRVAALGNEIYEPSRPKRSVTGGGVNWVASSGCLASSLKAVIYEVAANFGPVRVNSTCRSKRHNARVGGARRSHHLSGNAVDFRVRGNVSAVYAFLRGSGAVGGLKHYGGGLFHIDTGPRRTW